MKKIYRSLTRWASVMLLLLGFVVANAQQRVVTGRVTDDSGSGMPGVNVVKKGTTIGTATDGNGNFSLEAIDDDVLVISFIGYQSQEIRVGSLTRVDVKLIEDVETLAEVVVVGYGTQKKSDLTGALSSVTGETLRGSVTASVDQALQGRVAGVQVAQNSGQPGGVVSIRIRGTNSLTQSSEPLYVIDGIQVGGEAGTITGFDWAGGAGGQQRAATNPLAALNPNDIESIEVLKDASATAIYGSRAANGVIIITTKRGKKGQSTISYNGFYAVQDVYKTFDMMDLPTYAGYNNEVAQEVSGINLNPNFADPSLLGPGTDWQDAVFQHAPMQSHTLTIAGGNDATRYAISGGYFQQEGIIIGSEFERFNVRTNIDTKAKENINFGISLNFSRQDQIITLSDGGDGVISQAAQMAPHIPVKNFDGTYAGPSQQEQSAQMGRNPVGLALLNNNTAVNNRLMTNFYGDIGIVEGLNFRSEIGVDYNNTFNKAFFPTYEWGRVKNTISQLSQRSDMSFFWLWKNYLTYHRKFGDHDLTAMAGLEAQKSQFEGFTAYKINVPNDIPVMGQGEISNRANEGYKGWSSLYSQFARANYSFKDRYLLTATIRRDGSSKFGPYNRYGVFPSVSGAWRISGEDFMSGSNTISNMKLRVGYGEVGNQQIQDYAFGSALVSEPSYFGPATRQNAYSNPNVQWESTAQTNIGLDVGFFGGRIDLTVDVYKKIIDNLLLRVNLPNNFGSNVQGPMANVGKMENTGFEATLKTYNIDKGKFRWTTNANISVNRNKVTEMGGGRLANNLYWYPGFETASVTDVGYPVGQFYGYVMDGIFTSKEEIQNHAVQIVDPQTVPTQDNPELVPENLIERTKGVWLGDIKWRDLNGDNIIDSNDQKVIGDPNPDFTFGFDNSFEYGPFTLDVFIIGAVGGDILNYSRARNEQMVSNFDNQAMTVLNRARTQLKEGGTDINIIDHVELINPETNIPRFDNGGENRNHFMSSRWIEDGTFVRIQNVKLAYTLPLAITQKVKIDRAQVYVNVQNAATFTNYSGLDPQIGAFNQSSLQQNVDMGRYPSPRVFTFGINLDF